MTTKFRTVLYSAFSAAALLLVLVLPQQTLHAQDAPKETADVKKLNERVEMLEQTLKELKSQLAAMEEAK